MTDILDNYKEFEFAISEEDMKQYIASIYLSAHYERISKEQTDVINIEIWANKYIEKQMEALLSLKSMCNKYLSKEQNEMLTGLPIVDPVKCCLICIFNLNKKNKDKNTINMVH